MSAFDAPGCTSLSSLTELVGLDNEQNGINQDAVVDLASPFFMESQSHI